MHGMRQRFAPCSFLLCVSRFAIYGIWPWRRGVSLRGNSLTGVNRKIVQLRERSSRAHFAIVDSYSTTQSLSPRTDAAREFYALDKIYFRYNDRVSLLRVAECSPRAFSLTLRADSPSLTARREGAREIAVTSW